MSEKSKIDNCPNGKLSQKCFEQLHTFREIFICICLEPIISGKLANIFNHHKFQNILNTFCCCCWQCLTVFDNFGQFYKFGQLWPFLLLCQLYYIPGNATCKCILGFSYWHHQLLLSWNLHQPESHQLSLQKVLSVRDTWTHRSDPRYTWVR